MCICSIQSRLLIDFELTTFTNFVDSHQGAFCVKFTPKIHDCTPTFIINYIMIFETPRRRSSAYGTSNAPWVDRELHNTRDDYKKIFSKQKSS